jgi:hypothetical protein
MLTSTILFDISINDYKTNFKRNQQQVEKKQSEFYNATINDNSYFYVLLKDKDRQQEYLEINSDKDSEKIDKDDDSGEEMDHIKDLNLEESDDIVDNLDDKHLDELFEDCFGDDWNDCEKINVSDAVIGSKYTLAKRVIVKTSKMKKTVKSKRHKIK